MEKPGYKTTEFWLSLVAMIVGAIAASGILDSTETDMDNKLVGLIITVLGALGYTVTRGFTKSATAKADAVKSALPPVSNPL